MTPFGYFSSQEYSQGKLETDNGSSLLPFNYDNLGNAGVTTGRQSRFLSGSAKFILILNLCWMIGTGAVLNGCSSKESSVTDLQDESAEQSKARSSQPSAETGKSKLSQSSVKKSPLMKSDRTEKASGKGELQKGPQAGALLDRRKLKELGFDIFESPHLLLVSDGVHVEHRNVYKQLPPLVGQLMKRFRTDFPQTPDQVQLTGFIMRDRSLYLQAKLHDDDFANLAHGAHRGKSFWLNDQKTDYYRRHLLIHESVHCLMDLKPNRWPVWYLEGMAEYYALHRIGADGKNEFGVFPGREQIEGGFGRLQLIRDEIAAGRFRTISQIRQLNTNNFYPHKTSYAWTWALCFFLAEHSRTQKEFLQLGTYRDARGFDQFFEQEFSTSDAKLNAQWAVFVSSLVPGYDIARGSILWERKVTRNNARDETIDIQVNRSWQASGVQVFKGKEYRIEAEGRFTVAQDPVPWESEPQGVSIDYVDGQPLGQLQMVLFSPENPEPEHSHGFLQVIPVGRELRFKPRRDGELFFRINDRGSSWEDNKGSVSISVKSAGGA